MAAAEATGKAAAAAQNISQFNVFVASDAPPRSCNLLAAFRQ
jgi:hypothetical protein